MIQDLKFSLRLLKSNLAFCVVAVLTLALGIGANTAIFSVIHSVLLKALPYPDPQRLVLLDNRTKSGGHMSVAWPNFNDWRAQNRSFESMAAMRTSSYVLTGREQPEILKGQNTSASFFSLLGATPALGRFYNDEDDHPGAARVVVLNYGFWQRRFGSDHNAIGQSLTLDNV